MNVAQRIWTSSTTSDSRLKSLLVYGFMPEETGGQLKPAPGAAFHIGMACVCLATIPMTYAGSRLASIQLDITGSAIAMLMLFAILAPLPIYWHQRGWIVLREATLVIAWELLLPAMIPPLVLIAARSHLPLQDSFLVHADHTLGFDVPRLAAWAHRYWIGPFLDACYVWGVRLLPVAALAPVLAGKIRHAREFLLANVIAFVIGLPLFALLPAVGPWYSSHTAPTVGQLTCQNYLLSLRVPGPYVAHLQPAGIICFPSFHVIWAILCAAALWGFRPLRIPLALFSAMVILSTMTTGWHYLTDVLAGIAVAYVSLAIARVYAV